MCVCERERESECACVRACLRACVSECVCVYGGGEGGGSRGFNVLCVDKIGHVQRVLITVSAAGVFSQKTSFRGMILQVRAVPPLCLDYVKLRRHRTTANETNT